MLLKKIVILFVLFSFCITSLAYAAKQNWKTNETTEQIYTPLAPIIGIANPLGCSSMLLSGNVTYSLRTSVSIRQRKHNARWDAESRLTFDDDGHDENKKLECRKIPIKANFIFVGTKKRLNSSRPRTFSNSGTNVSSISITTFKKPRIRYRQNHGGVGCLKLIHLAVINGTIIKKNQEVCDPR